MIDRPLQTLRLPVAAGQQIAVDHLPGKGGVPSTWLFLHGLASARNGQKKQRIVAPL